MLIIVKLTSLECSYKSDYQYYFLLVFGLGWRRLSLLRVTCR